MANPKIVQIPFALNGDKNDIPNKRQAGQPPEQADWDGGFPPVTMQPLETGGIAPQGFDFNGIFYTLSSNLVFLGRGERYQFDAAVTDGYPKNAIIMSNDGAKEFQSIVDKNKNDPNKNTTGWKIYAGVGSTPSATSTVPGVVKLIDSLESDATDAALTAKQGKVLQDSKLAKTANAVSATKLQSARSINGVNFDGTRNITLPTATSTNGGTARFATPTEVTNKANVMAAVTPSDVGGIAGELISGITVSGNNNIRKTNSPNGAFELKVEDASTATKGAVQLNNTLTSASTTQALTAAQGKILQDNKLDETANAVSATKLQTARNINLAGDVSGSAEFDGSGDVTLQVKLTNNALDVLAYSPIAYPKNIAPAGFLMMMGQAISSIQYPILYGLYGSRLPDMRAHVLRGWDNGRGIDAGRTLLSEQGDAIRNITGRGSSGWKELDRTMADGAFFATTGGLVGTYTVSGDQGGVLNFDASKVVPTASENRVKSIAFNYIVKAG